MAVIYKIVNVVTDDFYVGSAVAPKRRKWEHWDALRKGVHHCVALQAAWLLYGVDAFEFELIEEASDTDILRIEDMWLQQHAGKPYCYNTAHTTQSPSATSPEVREKISSALKRRFAVSPESHPRYGSVHTDATKAKIRASKKANPVRPWLGKKRSPDTKVKISVAQKGIPKAPRTYTEAGLVRARENMRRNAREQQPATLADVVAKFPEDVRQRYDFNNAVYAGALVRIEGCVCPAHGLFSQYAAQFRKGRGCPTCGSEQRAASKRVQMLNAWRDGVEREKMLAARRSKG